MTVQFLVISSWSLFAFALGFTQYALLTELSWQKRGNINFNNFEDHLRKYDFKVSKSIFIIATIYSMIALIHVTLIREYYYLNVYMYLSFFGIIIVMFSTYIIHSRKDKNLDMMEITTIYQKVKSYYADLGQIDERFNKSSKLLAQLEVKNQQITDEILALVKQNKSLSLDDTVIELKNLISDYQSVITGSDSKLITKFNEVLNDYIRRKNIQTIQVSQLSVVQKTLESLVSDIITQQKDIIQVFITSVFEQDDFNSNESAMKLLDVLAKLSIPMNDKIRYGLLVHANQNITVRDKAYELYFSESNTDTDSFLNAILDMKYYWLIGYPLTKNLSKMQHTKLSLHMVEHDLEQLAYDYLMSIEMMNSSFITQVVKQIKYDNQTAEYFKVYNEIIFDEFNSTWPITRNTQNMYIAIMAHANKSNNSSLYETLKSIPLNENLDYEHQKIESIYLSIQREDSFLYDMSFKTLFLLFRKQNGKLPINIQSVISLSREYKQNLQSDYLLHLMLISLLFLISSSKVESISQHVLTLIQDISKHYPTQLSSFSAIQKPGLMVRALNEYLVTNQYDKTVDIINRCENERLLMKTLENGL